MYTSLAEDNEALNKRVAELETERDRLRAKLELIAKGQWNAGVERDLTAAQFARAALKEKQS